MHRPLIGAALAALAMFVWGFCFWALGVVDPFDHFSGDAAEVAVADALRAHVVAPGTYFVPDARATDEATVKAWVARHERGPVGRVVVQPVGESPMAGSKFLLGYLHMLATAALLALALWLARVPCARKRFAIGALIGIAAAIWAQLGQPIWFHAPWRHHLMVTVYDAVSWTLASAVLVRFTAPPESD